MKIDRRHIAPAALAFGLLAALPASALSADEQAVAKSLEAFRAAQAAKDPKALAALCAEELSYSHSDAHIEDKATFVKNATAPVGKMISLEYKDPTIRVVGDAAIHYDVKNWRFALNVTNIGDKIYVGSCQTATACFYGDRRRAIASASYKCSGSDDAAGHRENEAIQTGCGTASKRWTTMSRLVSSTRTVIAKRPS